MQTRRIVVLLLLVGIAFLFGSGSHVTQAAPQAAVLIVEFSDGYQVVRVVPFSTPTISGLDLIANSGLDVSISDGLVCKVGPDGCSLPDQHCWCSAPFYWNYFYWTGYTWSFVCPGPSTRVVSSGGVEYLLFSKETSPKPMDTSGLFDETRLAPGIAAAVVNADGSVQLAIESAGDTDGDGAVSARYRKTDAPWSEVTPLQRTGDLHTITLPTLSAGTWDVELLFADDDGVRGSTAWQTQVSIPQLAPPLTYLPLVCPPRAE